MTWLTPRLWRSIGGPRVPDPMVWIDTGSGAGIEVPASQAHRFTVPPFAIRTRSGGNAPAPVTAAEERGTEEPGKGVPEGC